MSRIGKLPIKLENGVSAELKDGVVTVKGPKGELSQVIACKTVDINIEAGVLTVTRQNDAKESRAAHGLYRALIANMVVGVEKGYKKELVMEGVGYKAEQKEGSVVLRAGYSHPITVVAPEGITLSVSKTPANVNQPEIIVEGIDKTLVGQVAADIKRIRKPDPYHQYGVRYKGEKIARKQAKKTGKK
ncbi:MAG: 50S ribosomal protein L6 [Christensenellaceae bacterium]|jgi:large subunit ribosomal protein L6|nr:50S ribosomal protein L6 [Christensenellaceae bacterium]